MNKLVDYICGKHNPPYPFPTLEVGKSFIVANRSVLSVRATAHNAGKRLGRKFKVKKWGSGARVWREE